MGCGTPLLVSETHVDLNLPANILLKESLQEGFRNWRSNHGVLYFGALCGKVKLMNAYSWTRAKLS